MSWNWLGWLMWILGIGFLGFVIHYIRVKQLMLIAKTKKRFDSKLFTQYVVMSLVAILWLGSLVYLRFIQPINYNDRQQVQLSTKYQPLQLHDQGNDYYYVLAKHSTSGSDRSCHTLIGLIILSTWLVPDLVQLVMERGLFLLKQRAYHGIRKNCRKLITNQDMHLLR